MRWLEFFEERPGRLSSQRLIFIIGSFYSMWMGGYILVNSDGKEWVGAMTVIASLFGTFAAGKLIQKNMEPKDKKDEPKLP
jgi:hypothetical protein